MLRSSLAIEAIRAGWICTARRGLAIMPSVKTASDTSQREFPAPSHVGIASEAAEIARQYRSFYTDPGKYEDIICRFLLDRAGCSTGQQLERDVWQREHHKRGAFARLECSLPSALSYC